MQQPLPMPEVPYGRRIGKQWTEAKDRHLPAIMCELEATTGVDPHDVWKQARDAATLALALALCDQDNE